MMRVGLAMVWVLAPAILIAFAMREWKKTEYRASGKVMPVAVALAVLAD